MKSAKAKSPLKAPPHRVPGQSVEEEWDQLVMDSVMQWIFMAVFTSILAGLEWYRYAFDVKPSPRTFTAAAVVVCAVAIWQIWRSIPKLKALRQARDGERAVGQFLDKLRAHGYEVFHDVLGDGFNIDHVLVGPAGVFTVETKTWSKPAKGRAEIDFDGERIRAAGREPDRDPIIQAKAQASWIRKLLNESAGRSPYVKPVVVFPGWYVNNLKGAFAEMWVLEPKALPSFLANEPVRISESDASLFAYHLSRHIRAEERS